MDTSATIAFLHTVADAVDALTLERYERRRLTVDTKPDNSPVSDADRAAERLIREYLERDFPGDAVYGEEEGGSLEHAPRRWIIDPIDGTRNYVRHNPVWATLIGVEENGQMVAGMASAPALGRRWWASRGNGAWLSENGGEPQRLRVSDIDRMDRAAFGFSSLSSWDETGRMDTLVAFARATWGTRAYGAFWPYMLLAEGAFDIAAQPGLDVYDMAALVPIVEEAGGTFTSLEGKPGPWWGSALVTNGKLHAAAQAIINETHMQPGSGEETRPDNRN